MLKNLTFYDDYGFQGGKPTYKLQISQTLFEDKNLYFLLHCQERNLVICSFIEEPKIVVIKVSENSLSVFDLSASIAGKIRGGFLTSSGDLLLQSSGRAKLYHTTLANPLKVSSCRGIGDKQWHGTWSIDQSRSGTIMYAEYSTTKEVAVSPLHVYRSTDGGINWQSALEVSSSPIFGKGDIRHFHTCQADPYISGRWYVSSGDKLTDNKLYISDDDGQTWQNISIISVQPLGYTEKLHWNDLLRFTTLSITEQELYWATDDNVGGDRAVLCRVNKNELTDRKITIKIDGVLSNNLARNIIKHSEGFLVTTEAKNNPSAADLFLRTATNLIRFPSIENLSKEPSGFTISKSSKVFEGNVAYALTDIHFLNQGQPSLVEFKLHPFSDHSLMPDLSSRQLQVTKQSKVVFFHAQRTAGSFLKSLFINEYGKDKCLFHQTTKDYCSWSKLNDEVLNKYKVYAGHENYYENSMLNQNQLLFMSIIRHPVERAISLYHYLQKNPGHKLHELSKNLDIVRFYQQAYEISPDYVSDTQTLRVSGQKSFLYAKSILDKNFYLVAPFERLPEIVSYLSSTIGFSKSKEIDQKPRVFYSDYYLDDTFINLILEMNKNDIELYNYSKIFFSMCKRDSDFY
ncbi:sialidase family protein [Rheinheimera soli]|uniref:Uncharacterized protein n=1 Tax=Rheinheimera soli TaxID=443616 RepID=A0ABU1VU91_9GAMM|nr:sialidase family protein [Rheinheimera soli]MDR7119301.1 hypothetical protein [Rheinheimera soli]